MEEDKPMSTKDKSDPLSDKVRKLLFSIFKNEADKREPKIIRVYSFRPISDYLYNELYYSYLSCSPVTSFNDPLDCPLYTALTIGKLMCETDKFYSSLIEEISHAALDLRMRCFVDDNKNEEVTTNTLMWAHYANSHKGILLCYELPDIIENEDDKVSFFKKVKYSESYRGAGLNTFGDTILFRDLISMVSTKNKAWEYENEIRLLHYSKNKENIYPEIRIEKAFLKKIYFGALVQPFDKQRIELFTRHYPNLQLYDTRMDPDNLLQLKSFPHIVEKKNLLDYAYMRQANDLEIESLQDFKHEKWPILVETGFRCEVDDLIMATNSFEEVLIEYDKLPQIRYKFLVLYVLLYKKEKSKITWEPNTMEDVHTLVKEIIAVYYNSRRNIHTVREHLGISDKFQKPVEID